VGRLGGDGDERGREGGRDEWAGAPRTSGDRPATAGRSLSHHACLHLILSISIQARVFLLQYGDCVQEEAQERRQASYRRALNKASDMSLSLRPAAADGAEEGTGGWGGVRVKEEPMETDGPAAGRVAVKKEPAEVSSSYNEPTWS
jgi:hypothetical protein